MRAWIVAIPCIEAAGETSAFPVARRYVGLARASDALLAGGLANALSDRGVEVVGASRIELTVDELSDDPVVDLGRHGTKLAEAIAGAIAAGAMPLIAGGTCNHFPGILAGLQRAYGAASRIGVIWLDSHGDCNTPRTTRSGMLWGMPVAVALGLCLRDWREGSGMTAPLPTDRLVFAGVRSLDPDEAQLIGATDAVMASLDPDQPGPSAEEAIAALAERVDHLYLHVDTDVLDRSLIPNSPVAVAGGPDMKRTLDAITAAMATGKVRAYGVMTFDPTGPGGDVSLASAMTLLVEGVNGGMGGWE